MTAKVVLDAADIVGESIV
jgi:sugar lactone lactonase YvrE